jgi:hypothetical protein
MVCSSLTGHQRKKRDQPAAFAPQGSSHRARLLCSTLTSSPIVLALVAGRRSLPEGSDHCGGQPDDAVAATICGPVIGPGWLAESGQRPNATFPPNKSGLPQFSTVESASRFQKHQPSVPPPLRRFVSFSVSSSLTNFALRSAIAPSAARLPLVRPVDLRLRGPISPSFGSLLRLVLVAGTSHHRGTSRLALLTTPRRSPRIGLTVRSPACARDFMVILIQRPETAHMNSFQRVVS